MTEAKTAFFQLLGLAERLANGGNGQAFLYGRLRNALIRRIATGEWLPGLAIPTERSLATEYNVSVGTIRRAIVDLVDLGILRRRQGSGTFVRCQQHMAADLSVARLTQGAFAPPAGGLSATHRLSRSEAT